MVLVYGEILVDLNKESNSNTFSYHVGGAPFNVGYCIHNMEGNVKFIGSVGNDLMGKFIIDFVNGKGIDSCIDVSEYNTTLAFVMNDSNGERSFCFYRNNTADYMFNYDSLCFIKEYDIVHLGSLMLSKKEGYSFFKEVVKISKDNNKLLSFDVNYRDDIFNSKEEAISVYKDVIKDFDIVKISKEELILLSNEEDIILGLNKLFSNNQKVFVTLGKEGSLFYYDGKYSKVFSIEVEPIDTTGAGDAFYGVILSFIDKLGIDNFIKDAKKYLYLANVMGAYATLKKGALEGVLTKDELMKVSSYEQ